MICCQSRTKGSQVEKYSKQEGKKGNITPIFILFLTSLYFTAEVDFMIYHFFAETSTLNSNQSSPDILSQLISKPNDQKELSQIGNYEQETLPFDGEFNTPIPLPHLQQEMSIPIQDDFPSEISVNGVINKSSTTRESNIQDGDHVSSLRLSQSQGKKA